MVSSRLSRHLESTFITADRSNCPEVKESTGNRPRLQPANRCFQTPRLHDEWRDHSGKLFVEKNRSYVLDTDGTQRDIDLQQIDRVVQPGITLKTTVQPTTMTYIDGTVLRGQITQLNADSIQLQTAFTGEPITSSLAGASLLKFESTTKTQTPVDDTTNCFMSPGVSGVIFH